MTDVLITLKTAAELLGIGNTVMKNRANSYKSFPRQKKLERGSYLYSKSEIIEWDKKYQANYFKTSRSRKNKDIEFSEFAVGRRKNFNNELAQQFIRAKPINQTGIKT